MGKTYWLIGAATVAAVIAGSYAYKANAADLGGNCCSDLEERIAELEATTARKGNRKVKLVISGEISKALLWHDIDGLPGANGLRAIDNPNSGTKIRFIGEANLGAKSKAGFVFELGYDETAGGLLGISGQVDDMTVRHSFAYVEGMAGKVSLGRTSTATDGIVEIDLSNTNIASLPMSLEPLWTYSGIPGMGLGILNPTGFDGGRANIVRYDTPTMAGFQGSAAWGGGQTASGDDLWDAALRYAGEFGGIRIAAGAGYRVENLDAFTAQDVKTLSGSASVMHVATGLFVNGAYGSQADHPLFGDIQAWQARGGISRNFFGIGATSVYAEYGDHKLKDMSIDSTMIGAGIVQSFDSAGLDAFVSYRSYDIGGGFDAQTGMGGIRIRF